MAKRVVDVLVPVALDRAYSYRVPDELSLAPGDIVRVSNPRLGVLENKVTTCDQAPPWRFGIADLMRNLAGRGLLRAAETAHV